MGVKIGCLWTKDMRDGRKILTGFVDIDGVYTKIVMWPNDRKRSATSPDFQIYINDWTPGRGDKKTDQSLDQEEGRAEYDPEEEKALDESVEEEVGGFSGDEDLPF